MMDSLVEVFRAESELIVTTIEADTAPDANRTAPLVADLVAFSSVTPFGSGREARRTPMTLRNDYGVAASFAIGYTLQYLYMRPGEPCGSRARETRTHAPACLAQVSKVGKSLREQVDSNSLRMPSFAWQQGTQNVVFKFIPRTGWIQQRQRWRNNCCRASRA